MLALRSTLVFSTLILTFFFVVTQSFKLNDNVKIQILGKPNQKRVAKEHNPPPCSPDGYPKILGLKDTGAKVGVLPYTSQMVKDANAKHAANATELKLRDVDNAPVKQSMAKRLFKSLKSLTTLAKRRNGQLRLWYNMASVKVATDTVDMIKWNSMQGIDIESQIIATGDLSGCTVLVVASPFAVIMIHVWERRVEKNNDWIMYPFGAAQQQKDVEFAERGMELLQLALRSFQGSIVDGFGNWFPVDTTVVQVVAPGSNREYDNDPNFFNPWYTLHDSGNPMGLIYPQAANTLQQLAVAVVIPGRLARQSMVNSYRRRFSNDIAHGMDDAEFVVIKPKIMDNKEVWAVMHYDDVQAVPIVRLS
ncbi:uncharacterized protein BP5553_00684 [Venustampulla echinocandica]|uniref:Uncharacterized protein n=1 Tax=Venustampulla echinocandica TaxID=2656787 RepID=A0A370TYV0_9HELO|nr:uncharacterized protein BP5553_00684 [Venustampulla echinocandica]RDL40705.1 hypothetical protein BP5553_00684 [Venustampulla echinocandica]